MRKIRVLIVDDAVVVRRMVGDALADDPAIEVVGAAATGRIALAKIPQVNPDVVTLDVEMPDMDGLETLKAIRKTYPLLPVIMFSTLTDRGAASTLDALSLGATDYVTKPANVGSVALAKQRVREQMVPKIKLYCGRAAGIESPSSHGLGAPRGDTASTTLGAPRRPAAVPGRREPGKPIEVVAIGVSTGGPNALAEVLPSLPATFPVPIVIVQHMPPVFTRLLAERLTAQSSLSVAEGVRGGRLEAGRVWIAPGDFHMEVTRDALGGKVQLHQGPPENSCRPAVDVLFQSIATAFGAGALAIVLTGMGQDGLRGCEAIREMGGQVLAQDEASSVVWGMPGFVARAGLADRVLPLSQVGPEMMRRVGKGATVGRDLP